MESKIVVLHKDGDWLELQNCFLVGAVEYPDKVVYHKFLFTKCEPETLKEMIRKAEQYLAELKKDPKYAS